MSWTNFGGAEEEAEVKEDQTNGFGAVWDQADNDNEEDGFDDFQTSGWADSNVWAAAPNSS